MLYEGGRAPDEVPEGELCGAAPGRALGICSEWHGDLVAGLGSIPQVGPGDTVWWHTDICHPVGNEHNGPDYASVIYIGSHPNAPRTARICRGRKMPSSLEARRPILLR